jgi:hypothetical protein
VFDLPTCPQQEQYQELLKGLDFPKLRGNDPAKRLEIGAGGLLVAKGPRLGLGGQPYSHQSELSRRILLPLLISSARQRLRQITSCN